MDAGLRDALTPNADTLTTQENPRMTLTPTMPTVADLIPGDVIAHAETGDPLTVIAVDPPEDGLTALTYRDEHGTTTTNVTYADAHVDRIRAAETYPAIDLYRNAEVRLALDEVAYLVDHIERHPDGSCRVTYSGDVVRDYKPGALVNAR